MFVCTHIKVWFVRVHPYRFFLGQLTVYVLLAFSTELTGHMYEHWHRQYPAKVPKRLYTSSWSEIRVTWIAIGPFVPWTNFRKPIWNPRIDEWSCIPKLLHGRATLVFILIIVFPLGSRVHLYMTRTVWSAKCLGQQVTIAPHETHQGNSCGSDVRSGTSILRQRACSCGWWVLSRY